eukprot:scaffold39117_cov148-Skeletonema_marinoi.AAC.10
MQFSDDAADDDPIKGMTNGEGRRIRMLPTLSTSVGGRVGGRPPTKSEKKRQLSNILAVPITQKQQTNILAGANHAEAANHPYSWQKYHHTEVLT